MSRILVVDDEAAMREVLGLRLEPWGYEVATAASGAEARDMAERLKPHVVLADLRLPDVSGLELLRWFRDGAPHCPVIMMTAYGSIDRAVQAMREGARDFLTKPIDYAKLQALLEALQSDLRQRQAARRLEQRLDLEPGLGPLVGRSRSMRKLFKLIRLLADKEASVIITGESGTGKELVAQTIHQLSPRSSGPFIAINTAAIAEGITESELFGHEKGAFTGAIAARPGWFQQADRGTLFLDELGEMPLNLQPKLLRILEEGKVRRLGSSRELAFDVRLLAATNRDPVQEVEAGRLRQDLYYRLNVFTIELDPLRKRKEDIPLLAQHFVRRLNSKHGTEVEGIRQEVLAVLIDYPWPGNVRELRNVVERAVILAGEGFVGETHLPAHVREARAEVPGKLVLPPKVTLAEAEKIVILETLKRVANNKAKAARQLGLDVKTIRNKLRLYGGKEEP